jgi:hypothetical protein
MAQDIARNGDNTTLVLHEKSADSLTPVQPFIQNHAIRQKAKSQ